MNTVSFNLGKKRLIPFIGSKFVINDSKDNATVTVHKTTILKDCILQGKNLIYPNVNMRNTFLGFGTYVNSGTCLFDLFVGSYCSISSNVKIINGLHPSEFVSTCPGFYSNAHDGIAKYADRVYFREFVEKKYS